MRAEAMAMLMSTIAAMGLRIGGAVSTAGCKFHLTTVTGRGRRMLRHSKSPQDSDSGVEWTAAILVWGGFRYEFGANGAFGSWGSVSTETVQFGCRPRSDRGDGRDGRRIGEHCGAVSGRGPARAAVRREVDAE